MAQTHERIVKAALALVSRGGYAAAGIPAVAAEAGVSTGLIYRYFDSKAALFDEVFRRAAQHEIDACNRAAAAGGSARARIARVAETFAERALRGRRLAYALLSEPVDPTIESERLHFRAPYREIFAEIIADGIKAGEIEPQNEKVLAAAIVGGIAESLVGPLSEPPEAADETALVRAVARFCVQAVGPEPQAGAGS